MIVSATVRLAAGCETGSDQRRMSIAVEGNQTRRVVAELLGEPSIAVLHDTNGRWDLLAQLRAETLCRNVAGAGAHPADQGHQQHQRQHSSGDLPRVVAAGATRGEARTRSSAQCAPDQQLLDQVRLQHDAFG